MNQSWIPTFCPFLEIATRWWVKFALYTQWIIYSVYIQRFLNAVLSFSTLFIIFIHLYSGHSINNTAGSILPALELLPLDWLLRNTWLMSCHFCFSGLFCLGRNEITFSLSFHWLFTFIFMNYLCSRKNFHNKNQALATRDYKTTILKWRMCDEHITHVFSQYSTTLCIDDYHFTNSGKT